MIGVDVSIEDQNGCKPLRFNRPDDGVCGMCPNPPSCRIIVKHRIDDCRSFCRGVGDDIAESFSGLFEERGDACGHGTFHLDGVTLHLALPGQKTKVNSRQDPAPWIIHFRLVSSMPTAGLAGSP